MASIPGSHYNVYAGGQGIHFGVVAPGEKPPAAVRGDYNLEVIMGSPTGRIRTPTGYQGVVVLSNDQHTLRLVHGSFQVTDAGGNDSIIAGDGNVSIIGAGGDTILGGTGNAQLLDGSAGNQLIIGGSRGNETIRAVASDTVIGGSGGNETIFGGVGETIIGGAANTLIDATAGNESILAGSGRTTILGGADDTIQGALGAAGRATISFSAGTQTIWDNGSSSNGRDTVTGFDPTGGDRISVSSSDNIAQVIATATQSKGNMTIHLHDGSAITLIGVSSLDSSFFTTH